MPTETWLKLMQLNFQSFVQNVAKQAHTLGVYSWEYLQHQLDSDHPAFRPNHDFKIETQGVPFAVLSVLRYSCHDFSLPQRDELYFVTPEQKRQLEESKLYYPEGHRLAGQAMPDYHANNDH